MKNKELAPKQEMFCREYIIGLNAIKAAVHAKVRWKKAEGYYVYFLIDPNGMIFYIGKGKGRRISAHRKKAYKGVIDNVLKHQFFHNYGDMIQEKVFACSLLEDEAYEIERILIDRFKGYGLTNISHGVMSDGKKAQAKAKWILSQLKSLEEWERDKAAIELAKKAFGDHRECYYKLKNELEKVAAA